MSSYEDYGKASGSYDDTRVAVVHEWEDVSSFMAYQQSESFARSGVVIRPLMTAAPVSRRFAAQLLETVG